VRLGWAFELVSGRKKMDLSPTTASAEALEAATACLERSPYLPIRSVSCEYDHGLLFLRGQVSCYYHKQIAQEAVSRIEAVTQVVNRIVVVSSPG